MFASSRWRKISRQRAAELCGIALDVGDLVQSRLDVEYLQVVDLEYEFVNG